jgi:hypothetical protein
MGLQASTAAYSESTTYLEAIAKSMLEMMSETGMPKCFQTDVAYDLKVINSIDAELIIWLLFDRGSTAVPVHQGSPTKVITHWLNQSDLTCKAYLINRSQPVLAPISPVMAAKLISEHPVSLHKNMKLDELEQAVNEALIKLKSNDWLSLSNKDLPSKGHKHWKGLNEHFKSLQNDVMTSFMNTAISIKRSSKIRAV